MIYLQIQQGTLGPHTNIIDEPKWKNVEELFSEDLYSTQNSTHYPTDNGSWTEIHKNSFVYVVTKKQNLIFLNDLQIRPNTVLTGVSFNQDEDALQLAIQETAFDYDTGRLRLDFNMWLRSQNPINRRYFHLIKRK